MELIKDRDLDNAKKVSSSPSVNLATLETSRAKPEYLDLVIVRLGRERLNRYGERECSGSWHRSISWGRRSRWMGVYIEVRVVLLRMGWTGRDKRPRGILRLCNNGLLPV